jgi:predicted acetyltransferase
MTAAPYPIRILTADDWPAALHVDSNAFGMAVDEEGEKEQLRFVEWGRWIGAFDDSDLVGLTAVYSFTMSLPGGAQPVAGVTWVGVLPTHRRRGILRSLMTEQLHGLHETGAEPWAALWASEPVIYGRFGYGLASRKLTLVVPRSADAVRSDAPYDPALRVRLNPVEDWKPTAPVYETLTATRPGLVHRTEQWHERSVLDLPSMREGRSPLRCVVAEDAGGVRGYARYAVKAAWGPAGSGSTVHVRELVSVDPAAHAALLRYLCDLDLTAEVELWNLPEDDPAWFLLTDFRRAVPRANDALHVRLVDVDRSLSQRTYETELDVVLDVDDQLCPWNSGRWRLRGGPDGATCERTTGPADVALPVVALGSAYLGGPTLLELSRAGLVREQRAGALAAASAAFAHDPKPWTAFVF